MARWWTAILAPRGGWKAVVRCTPKREFLAPWAVSRSCDTAFGVRYSRSSPSPASNPVSTPLSSDRAFDALAAFARLHGLESQFTIAFVMALTIPTHQHYRSSPKLPLPGGHNTKVNPPLDASPSTWTRLNSDLPYYMTLSCSPELHPILNEVLSGISSTTTTTHEHEELLAIIGVLRQPPLSAFWIGAIASGLGSEILRRVKEGQPPLHPLAYPWTGCAQGFMDLAGEGPYTTKDREFISRADAWRLMRLPSAEEDNSCFQGRPRTPWAPCGVSRTRDCALRITAHLGCERHEYRYECFVWEMGDGDVIRDYGCEEQVSLSLSERISDVGEVSGHFQKAALDQVASREVSLDVFRWFYDCGDGVPFEDVYRDDWSRDIWEDEDEGGVDDHEPDDRDSQRSYAKRHIPQSKDLVR
ncbi:hypothetical protein BO71DRAFT_480632 [Aspergillus ellipticus CBS 707.79]|uniref:Uncharacterized protein n=1 Tax=Aspergillus ellipticus CBS 707.79 TaxID=1448320 RepID=A0A319DV96_9EURO|nr:hypothetical protein BO71DRAFT_480632 [Aspergillus ellipticus CBS 707.79]